MKIALLIVSICCLTPPFTPIGVGGLIALGMLSLLFRVADEGVEQMAEEIQQGNQAAGGCWLWSVMLFVFLGGLVVLAVFGTIAGNLRGAF